ncbi:AAA family ATPase [Sinorhizobium medicae]|nr:AAA family ATPase [Sinorhizobium medicae]MDX0471011.1 AAA family ATPase [Sinorhizobium medicae]
MAEVNLSPAQRSVVEAPIGEPMVVLASAGSGKTRVLTERVRYICSQTNKDGIIAFTFTNAAAAELKARLQDSINNEDRLWVGTIHSIAQRMLEQYGQTIGLPGDFHIFERDQDRMEVFLQSLRDAGVDIDEYLQVPDQQELRSRERALQRYLAAFAVIKREMLAENEVHGRFPEEPGVWRIFQDYQRALITSGGVDFDDILVLAHRLLLTQEWVGGIYRARYKHVCVDEAQDLNRIQYEFIKALSGSSVKSVMMVGDPNQMIYGFNGSNATYMTTTFIQDFGARQYILSENYRSTKSVIAAANKLKPLAQETSQYALQGAISLAAFPDEEAEAKSVVATIKQILTLGAHPEIEGPLSLDKMVVIARNRFAFASLEKELKQQEVPFFFGKGERSAEATSIFGRILDYGLRLKINPKNWIDAKKLVSLLGAQLDSDDEGAITLNRLSDGMGQSVPFPSLQHSLLIHLNALDIEEPNMRKFVSEMERELASVAPDKSSEDERFELERSIEELREFADCWTAFKAKGLGSSLVAFRNAMALGQLHKEQQPNGLILSTVHTMKGLEKDIVFLIHMCEGVFPDYRAQTSGQLNEERNAAFVAVTRARRWLYISYPQTRKLPWGAIKPQRRSRFLDEIEQEAG